MFTSSRRTALVAAAIAVLLMSAAAACSSSSEGGDPTSTLPTASGTVPPDGDGDDDGTTSTTRDDPPRTGTSVIEDDEDPPTGDETEQDYIDALVATFEAEEDQLFTKADVECLAAAWVPAIGVETFQEVGVTPADIESGDSGLDDVVLDRSTAEEVVDAIPGCGIELVDIFIDTLGPDVKDDPTKVACVEGAVTEDQIRDFLVDDILGAESTDDTQDPEDLVGTCLV